MQINEEPIPADLEFYDYDTRLAAYAVIVQDDRVLLAWWNGEGHSEPGWSMPGGGVDLPETAAQGVVREVREETGYDVEVTGLLGVDSYLKRPEDRFRDTDRWARFLRVVYSARVVGGAKGHWRSAAPPTTPSGSRSCRCPICRGPASWTSR